MKRGWFLVLCVSLGLNAALLFVLITGHIPGRDTTEASARGPGGILHRMMEERWRAGEHGPQHDDGPGPHRLGQMRPGFPPGEFSDSLLHMRLHHLGRRLDLDEEQAAELENVLTERLPQLLNARMSVFEMRREIFEAVGRNEPDAEHVRALVRELSRAQTRLDSLMIESILQEAENLTPEQREGYFRAMPWHAQGPGQMRGKGRGRR